MHMAGPQHKPSSTASKQQLSVWGLPAPILEAFHKKGLKQLYPWQAAALDCAAAGNNLVYCAPTSGEHAQLAAPDRPCACNQHSEPSEQAVSSNGLCLFKSLAAHASILSNEQQLPSCFLSCRRQELGG